MSADSRTAVLRCKNVRFRGQDILDSGTASRCGPRQGTHIHADRIAKTLPLVDRNGFALAVVPKNRRIDLIALEKEFKRRFRMASGEEIERLFPGLSFPTLAASLQGAEVETFVDQALVSLAAVYFETPSPYRLVRIEGESFRGLFYGAWCGRISCAER